MTGSRSLEERGSSKKDFGVCIIVENCPLPADRRVWQEAVALKGAGYNVSIICPSAPGFEGPFIVKDGIEIFPHPTREGSGVLGYIFEYLWALLIEFRLALRVYRRNRFQVLQACNPPDNIFLIALFFKLIFGVRFIFDHHDPSPELYQIRFGKRGIFYWLLRLFERLTFLVADVTVATNETIREIALTRGKVSPERAYVVRTCPDLQFFRLPAPNSGLRNGRSHLVVYLGNMGPQDGLDLLLDSIHEVIKRRGRQDTTFALIGSGSEAERLKQRSTALGLDEYVTFTGALYGDALLRYLATADIGVAPDPFNLFNDQLTMLKTMEYLACGLPIVQYDLKEGRRTAGAAALYAKPNDTSDFARRIEDLLDSEELRAQLGQIGKRRISSEMTWDAEKARLLAAYRACCPHPARLSELTPETQPAVPVDLLQSSRNLVSTAQTTTR